MRSPQLPPRPFSLRAVLVSGVAVSLLAAGAVSAQTQTETGALPDVSIQAQSATQTALERQRFLAGDGETGTARFFGEIYGNNFDFSAASPLAAFEAETRGGLFGVQTELYEGLTIGGAVSRQSGDISFDASGGGSDFRDTSVHGFASLDFGGLILGLNGDYGRNKYENIFRAVAAAPGSATGESEGSYWRLAASARTVFELDGGARISPSLTYDYSHTVVDSYGESGPNGFTTQFQRQSVNLRRLTAAVDFEGAAWQLTDGMAFVPTADVRYSRALSGETHNLAYTPAAAAIVNTSMPGYYDGGFSAGIGGELRFDSGWAIGGRYSRGFSGDTDGSHAFGLSLSRDF